MPNCTSHDCQCNVHPCEHCQPMTQNIRPMTPEEIVAEFSSVQNDDGMNWRVVGKEHKDWLRTSLRALLLHVGESLPEKDVESYDNMVCSACDGFVRERWSHNSEDGFSPCHGKKLKRQQGGIDAYTERNSALDDCKRVLDKIISEI